MKKRKIEIVDNRMIIGGVEKACIALLDALDYERYEIHFFTHTDHNPYIDQINKHVILHGLEEYLPVSPFSELKHGRVISSFRGALNRVRVHMSKMDFDKARYSYASYTLPHIEFDLAIAFRFNYPDIAMVLYALKARKRALFIHIDPVSNTMLEPHLQKFDKILCVSKAMQDVTAKIYPSIASKICVFYNLVNVSAIRSLADRPLDKKLVPTSLLTVGRLCSDKCQDMIPKVARMLLDAGYDIHWYLVGDGPLRHLIEIECSKQNVADRVILLGSKENPYPYMKACDIYVQPSKLEGWGLTVQEARILQKATIVSPLPVMYEQIHDYKTGIIIDEITPAALYRGIKTLLDDPQLCKTFCENLSCENSDGTEQLQQIYDLAENEVSQH